jgi:hypothetical protein
VSLLYSAQIVYGAHPASYSILLVVFSPEVKQPERETNVIFSGAGVNNVE